MSESTMIALTLEIAAIALLLMVASVVYVFWKAAHAPMGFEDWGGFHLDAETPPARGETRRRKRIVAPLVAAATDKTVPEQIHHGPPAEAAL